MGSEMCIRDRSTGSKVTYGLARARESREIALRFHRAKIVPSTAVTAVMVDDSVLKNDPQSTSQPGITKERIMRVKYPALLSLALRH